MSLKRIAALALAGAMAITTFGAISVIAQDIVVDPAIATMTAEQVVEARQDAMKQNGGILRDLGSGLAGADAVAAADTLIQNFTNLPALYPEGSIVGDSKALPLIWEDKEAFDAIFAKAREHAVAIRAAAEAGDAAAIVENARAIGGLCGQCHSKYRA